MNKEIRFQYEYYDQLKDIQPEEQKLFQAAKKAATQAYAKYSNFHVGTAILLDNNEIILGNNQENAAYPSGMCAERTAIYSVGANFPKAIIKKIFITGGYLNSQEYLPAIPPCGACRQSLLEYEQKQNQKIEILFSSFNSGIYKVNSVQDLLPFQFHTAFLK